MDSIYVGTGGWYDYKKDSLAPGMRLKAYAKKFNFVEVNSTFYKLIDPTTVERWRQQVPEDFEFSVKCYQALTHKIGIKPVEDAFNTINTMIAYCKALHAKILLLESPAFTPLNEKSVEDAGEFFHSLSLDDVRIAWEIRRRTEEIPDILIDLMKDLDIIHAVDLSWEEPRYTSDITYTRVFGNPKNEFRLGPHDYEKVARKVRSSGSKMTFITTHGLRMVDDAEKLIEALKNDSFPKK